MEATVVSVAKSVLDGALSSAKSAVAEEVTLQLGVQRDLAFIKDEFEMMQTFLIVADEERSQKKVVKTWVKQVRDLAYDVEDCLQDFAVRLQKRTPWWRFPRTLQARHRIAMEIKELRARVDDVSQRNLRYCLISDGRLSNPAITSAGEPYGTRSMAAFGAQSDTGGPEGSKVDLMKFISSGEKALRVISVWGKSDLGRLSIIRKAYDDPNTKENFGCRAWVKVMHPFNPGKFIRSLVLQLFANSTQQLGIMQEATVIGIEIMNKIDKMAHECLIKEFARHVNEKKYLIVLDDLYAMEEWDWIKTCLPDKENGSRIVVSTQHHEIAQLCVEQPVGKAELRNLSYDHPPAYVSFNKDEQAVKADLTEEKAQTMLVGPPDEQAVKADLTEEKAQTRLSGPPDEQAVKADLTEEKAQTMLAGPPDEQAVKADLTEERAQTRLSGPPGLEHRGSDHMLMKHGPTNKIEEEGLPTSEVGRNLVRNSSMVNALEEARLIGREKDKAAIVDLISRGGEERLDIAVFGMDGVGKTALVENIYQCSGHV